MKEQREEYNEIISERTRKLPWKYETQSLNLPEQSLSHSRRDYKLAEQF